jgi:hypothetical protein
VLDPAGADATASLDNPANAGPTFTAPANPGTYRVTCTVTDSDGLAFSDSVQILVGMPLSLAVLTDKWTLAGTDTATVTAVPNGGIPAYTYAWTVLNPAGTPVTATVLSDSTAQSPNFVAPVTGGTYRLSCTVTDSQGTTFTSVVHLYVATRSVMFNSPDAADDPNAPTSVKVATPIPNQYTVIVIDADLPHPRNLQVRLTDPNDSVTGSCFIAVDGVSADGHFQTEFFAFTAPGAGAGGGTTVAGTKPFSRVEIVRWVRKVNVGITTPGGDEQVMIGVGNVFGLPEILSSAASVRQVTQLPNTALSTPADYTVITTAGRQGVSFTNPPSRPNGGRSYEIFFDDN